MNEQTQTTGQATETPTQEGAGSTTQTQGAGKTQRENRIDGTLAEIKAEREKLDKANAEKRELQAAQREIDAQKALGGNSEAGQTAKPKEETPKEYNDRIEKEINEGQHNG